MTQSRKCSCILCKKEISNLGLPGHIKLAHTKDHKFIEAGNAARRGKPSWCKDKNLSEEHKLKLSLAGKGRVVSLETRTKISNSAKQNGLSGGFRVGGGRGKKGIYNNIHCDSSWELAFLIWAFDHHESITRINTPRFYEFEGKIRKYFPDFLVDGKTIEIKGWQTDQWEKKLASNPDVIVIGNIEIQPMLEYAIKKFGKDFLIAYEKM